MVPSTSSLPQRPQFVFCLKRRSNSAADILVGAELFCWAFALGPKRPKLRASTLPPAAARTRSLVFIYLSSLIIGEPDEGSSGLGASSRHSPKLFCCVRSENLHST